MMMVYITMLWLRDLLYSPLPSQLMLMLFEKFCSCTISTLCRSIYVLVIIPLQVTVDNAKPAFTYQNTM